jgi:hypothetical protein
MVKLLLEAGADVNQSGEYGSPLLAALDLGSKQAVKLIF